MSKREIIALSELKDVQILWPGDFYILADFVLRCFETDDAIQNAKVNASRRHSYPSLHGLAAHYARISRQPLEDIEQQLTKRGFWMGSGVTIDGKFPCKR